MFADDVFNDARQIQYFVSPQGNDTNPGTRERPFATLECARDALRKAKKAVSARGGATVWLMGGVYELSRTFELTSEDSGMVREPVIYRSMPDEEVRTRYYALAFVSDDHPVAKQTKARLWLKIPPLVRGRLARGRPRRACDRTRQAWHRVR